MIYKYVTLIQKSQAFQNMLNIHVLLFAECIISKHVFYLQSASKCAGVCFVVVLFLPLNALEEEYTVLRGGTGYRSWGKQEERCISWSRGTENYSNMHEWLKTRAATIRRRYQ